MSDLERPQHFLMQPVLRGGHVMQRLRQLVCRVRGHRPTAANLGPGWDGLRCRTCGATAATFHPQRPDRTED